MKKLLLGILFAVSFVALTVCPADAQLLPGDTIQFDLSVIGGSGTTDIFERLNGQTTATSTYTTVTPGVITAGDTFVDAGVMAVGSLFVEGEIGGFPASVPVNDLGLGTGSWTLVASWTDIMGSVTSDSGTGLLGFEYTSGSIILEATMAGGASFTVATLEVVGGSGFLNLQAGPTDALGSIDLDLVFTSALEGFWLDYNGNDIAAILAAGGEASLNLHTNNIVNDGIILDEDGNPTITTSNGTDIDVTIPEPASMALFASGLFGLAGAARRKKRA